MRKTNFARMTSELLALVRTRQPLVHHITNLVVMNSTANVTLAVGGSPIMAHAHEELAEIAAFASALNLNIGTLDEPWVESMFIAGRAAAARNVPIILDPVGVGATALRSRTAIQLLNELPVAVVRGNASEIMALAGSSARSRGVDSLESADDARTAAAALALRHKNVVAVTGAVDFITDGLQGLEVRNGHPLFERVTGTGCAATAVISCFCAVSGNRLLAAACALAYYGACGEIAAAAAGGPGTFPVHLLDALHSLCGAELEERVRIRLVDETDREP